MSRYSTDTDQNYCLERYENQTFHLDTDQDQTSMGDGFVLKQSKKY